MSRRQRFQEIVEDREFPDEQGEILDEYVEGEIEPRYPARDVHVNEDVMNPDPEKEESYVPELYQPRIFKAVQPREIPVTKYTHIEPTVINLFNAIRKRNTELFADILDRFELDRLEPQTVQRLVIRTIEFASEINMPEFVRIAFQKVEETDPNEGSTTQLPLINQLLTLLDRITDEQLMFAIESIGPLSRESIIVAFIENDDSDANALGVSRLFDVMGDLPIQSVSKLAGVALRSENFKIAEFLKNIVRESGEAAPAPSWFKKQREPIVADDVSDAVMIAMRKSGIQIENETKTKEDLQAALDQLPPDQLAKLLAPFVPCHQHDRFSKLGPVNPAPCDGGTCKMFECNHMHAGDEDDDIIHEGDEEGVDDVEPKWFTGDCQTCGKNISDYRQAIRLPLLSGDWTGQYCGEECVNEALRGRADAKEIAPLLKRVIAELRATGIYSD